MKSRNSSVDIARTMSGPVVFGDSAWHQGPGSAEGRKEGAIQAGPEANKRIVGTAGLYQLGAPAEVIARQASREADRIIAESD